MPFSSDTCILPTEADPIRGTVADKGHRPVIQLGAEPLVSPLGARPREGLGEYGQDVIDMVEFEAVTMHQELPARPRRAFLSDVSL